MWLQTRGPVNLDSPRSRSSILCSGLKCPWSKEFQGIVCVCERKREGGGGRVRCVWLMNRLWGGKNDGRPLYCWVSIYILLIMYKNPPLNLAELTRRAEALDRSMHHHHHRCFVKSDVKEDDIFVISTLPLVSYPWIQQTVTAHHPVRLFQLSTLRSDLWPHGIWWRPFCNVRNSSLVLSRNKVQQARIRWNLHMTD